MADLQFMPDLSPDKATKNLSRLIVRGKIMDRDIESRITRLRERFRIYASTCPHGLWAPGLALTAEARKMTDFYLPMTDLKNAFKRFLSISLKHFPPATESIVHGAETWLDALHQLQPYIGYSDPSALLRRLMEDESFRTGFLFALFLPKQHGGSFNRYAGQLEYLRQWLKETRSGSGNILHCLDTACATGESTYELAMLLMESGMEPDSFLVHGSSVEPLEIFAAAHIFFPHDSKRQAAFRKKAEPVFSAGANKRIMFFTEDISQASDEERPGYDIILCNGLLGGPKYHNGDDLAAVVSSLDSRLENGGIIMVADKFHGGWKKLAPMSLLQGVFKQAGFLVYDIADGFVAQRA